MTVIVVGGGNAGICAALSARDAGADVLLLERAPEQLRGGNSRHTRDIRHAHDSPDEYMTGSYGADEFLADLSGVGGGADNPRLARLLIQESKSLPGWMAVHGASWQAPLQGTLHLGRTNRFFLGGGKALLNSYYRTASEVGIEVRYDVCVEEIVIEHGVFRELRLSSEAGAQTLRGSALVVASGGFEANLDWLSRQWGVAASNFVVRGTPLNDGRVITSLLSQGAQSVGDPRRFHAVAVDARGPRVDGGIVTRLDSLPFGIVINQVGDRFADEGQDLWPKRYASWGGLIAAQPEQIAYSIFDSQSRRLFMPPLHPPLEAEDLPGLATRIGVAASKLMHTVSEFNQSCSGNGAFDPERLDGRSTQGLTVPKTNWAVPLDQPPYFAFPLRVGLSFTYFGLAVDEWARVLGTDGRPWNNVFAAGETMMGNVLGRGYLAGIGLTIGSVFGRIAGRAAATTRSAD
ncbi:MAG TPA: FAD-dependent tricarballylate dehydrogenase TcuA [Candidatus Micrarchaeaceae archaeon]|nr:FAD-dependent tricarballylate dehydrogenase TcuA [Candidatus Micrarchaeaceae archaeon]